ncbi:SpvB/TcaC N-terminal domain-containing protein [Desulfonema magnum]|nr:SpvB/TcaC N-terminal domain-containing protein [Desulfonema magnum]
MKRLGFLALILLMTIVFSTAPASAISIKVEEPVDQITSPLTDIKAGDLYNLQWQFDSQRNSARLIFGLQSGEGETPLLRVDALNHQGNEGKIVTIPEDTKGDGFHFVVYSKGIKIYQTEKFSIYEPSETLPESEGVPVTISSTPDGGRWNDPDTWEGGVVPSGDHVSVNIYGDVVIDRNMTVKDLTIHEDGSLSNVYHRVLQVTGSFSDNNTETGDDSFIIVQEEDAQEDDDTVLNILKNAPHSLITESAEASAVTETVANLFDRNVHTSYEASGTALVDVSLDKVQSVSEIRIYGSASYKLTVREQVNGQWRDVESLENLDLSALSDEWHHYEPAQTVETDALRFQLIPTAAIPENVYGIREIEIWSSGEHTPVQSGNALLALMDAGVDVEQGRRYQADPEMGVIGPEEGQYADFDQDNVFHFDLAYQPDQIKRAYLSYDLSGLAHQTGAIRSVNDQPAVGGYVIEHGEGGAQIEGIAPVWLNQGGNVIRFKPLSDDERYVVSNVRVVIELDNGSNSVSYVRSNQSRDESAIASVYDGDMSTGLKLARPDDSVLRMGWMRNLWQKFSGSQTADESVIELGFDRLTDLTAVGFYATAGLEGEVGLALQKEGQWVPNSGVIEGKRKQGWHYLNVQDGEYAQGARLVFTDATGTDTEIREVRALGSNLGSTDAAMITITYPDKGQYFGDQVYVRGFVSPVNNGSGQAELYFKNQKIAHVNGEFEAIIKTENTSIELTAVYPDGETVASVLPLLENRLSDEIEIREGCQTLVDEEDDDEDSDDENQDDDGVSGDVNLIEDVYVRADKDHKHEFKSGAKLEVGKGALKRTTKISMMTLRDRDLPALDAGMVNVTDKHKGYRFLPHGMKFDKKVKVRLPYKKDLIPEGMEDKDVRTYFFDEASGRWVPLAKESFDPDTGEVVSETDHFTDMINAVVQVPDSPQTTSFNPTQIKDIKVANPAAKVNLIEPPQANNQGDARLSYPLEVPPGRKGMQPQLAVQYSSGGGNGWMGLGWDLPVQMIGIDTRWGVPRYDAGKETETYTLSGQQLTPVAHRSALVARTSNKIFHTRVEGGFQKIIRHGDSPKDYWWEVIDKNGTHSFYGGTDAYGPDENAILTDDEGNIAKWALSQVQDSNGNTIDYEYVRQQDSGVGSGSGGVAGYELYLANIFYTGYGNSPGPYQVTFLRDRDLGEIRRSDVTIDARLGFKKVTADLLRKAEVRYNGQMIRSYEFVYTEGAFKKTLLKSIIQLDEHGEEFNRHDFEYFDEARNANGGYHGFGSSETWNTGDDDVNGGLVYHGEASAIGGTGSNSVGGHMYVGIAVGGCDKKFSIGGKVGYNQSKNKGILTFSDVNGDGLPDKIFGYGNVFRPNLSGPGGATRFGDPIGIGLGNISREKSKMFSYGAELYLVGGIGINRSNSFTESDTYLSDVNGDGIIDLVKGGSVRFGRPDDPEKLRPVPYYGSDSSDTPYPVGPGAVDGQGLLEDFQDLYEEMLKASPLHDTLRRWTAPFAGQIAISGDIALVEDTSEERAEYRTADGVRVAIQHNSSELWAAEIDATDYSVKSPQGLEAITVEKGDRIYFRVQSRFDGAYDQVRWDPEIAYLNMEPVTDANDLNHYVYQASADFIPTGRSNMSVSMPITGSIHLSGDVEKLAATSDDIRVLVLLNDEEVFSQTSGFDQMETISVDLNLDVTQEDQLKLKIEADSPIDLTQIRWKPHLEYLSAEGVETVYDDQGNSVITFDPPYLTDVYGENDLNAPPEPWIAPRTGIFTVTSSVTTTGIAGRMVLTAKRVNELLDKATFDVSDAAGTTLSIDVAQGDEVWFELNTTDRELAQGIGSYRISVDGETVPSALNFPGEEGFFGQPFRGWTYAGYKGDGERAAQAIIESDLVIPEIDQSQIDANMQVTDPDELDPQFSPEKADGILFYPDPASHRWRGFDDGTWVGADIQSSSRLGMDNISVPKPENYAGARAVNRLSEGKQTGVFAGLGPAGASVTNGETRGLLDFMDMNGDRFPDVVSDGSIQYSPMIGGLEGNSRAVPSGIRKSETEALSAGVSGTVAHVRYNSRGNSKGSGEQMASFGLSGNFGSSKDQRNYDYNDINGDGLPDKVYDDGSAALNLGYKFGSQEYWGTVQVGEGEAQNLSLGASFNDGVYGFGGGVGISESKNEGRAAWLDINGDGLADYVRKGGGVALNTGNGFVSISYPGAGDFSENVNTDQSGGLYFTISIPIPIPFLPICIIINPGAEVAKGISRPQVAIMDIDGDGYADHLTSEKDSSIKVRRNLIGRTNLLKTVRRPLGATITIEYERDGNTYQMPHSRWNMTRVDVHDGFAGDGVDTLVTTYQYEDGFYHRQEREFYGYETVTTEQRNAGDGDSLYRSTVQNFKNRNYYEKGLLISEIVRDGAGKKYLETTNAYQLRDVDSGNLLTGEFKESLTATVFPELIRTDKKFYEGQTEPGITTYQTFEYDELGNVTHFFDAADAGAGDDVESFIEYHSDLAHYIVGKANKIVVKGSGEVMRQRNASFETGTGNLRQVSLALGTGTAIHDMAYDQYGNIITQTGPANKKGQRYAITYTYDGQVHTYPEQVRDSFGYVSAATYDLRWGEITSTTDINGQQLTYRYDSVGRAVGITGPYQQGAGRETLNFAYHPGAVVPWALTQHFDNYDQKTDPLETALFVDGLKREIQTKKDGAVSSGNANAQNMMIVSGRVIFDFAGRAVEQYYPITESLGRQGQFNSGFDSVQPTRTSHDVMDRVLVMTMPDNTSVRYAYGFGTDRNGALRFQTKVTDANQISKVNYKDVRELITSVQEFNKGKTLWTSYEYDPMKQIVQLTDNAGNVTSVQYDLGGRRTHIDSPDMGLTEYEYDTASNMVRKITANLRAKGQAIEYDYTYNRVDGIRYPEYTENDVSYTYGDPGAGDNRAGRIVTVSDASGKEERFYGPLGETIKTIKTVTSETQGNSNNSPEVYKTEYTYDTYNRLRQLIYPDSEVLTYTYNSGGLADSASGIKGKHTYRYLQKLTYDKFEQRVYMKQGNGAETTYAYNPLNRRLSTLKAKSNGRFFMNLAYGYDPVGNVLNLDNLAKANKAGDFGGETHYDFEYDDLYRLTDSSGDFKQKTAEHTYTLSMKYDSIHNIVSKAQQHIRITPAGERIEQKKTTYTYKYDYGSSKPHAPTHIGERTFTYDANGNQTGWQSDDDNTQRIISWDEENRIQQIEDNGHLMTYKYNDAGERVFKTGPQGEMVYVNQFYTVKDRERGTKHVFVGTSRIVSKLVKGQEDFTTSASDGATARSSRSPRKKPDTPPGQENATDKGNGPDSNSAGGNANPSGEANGLENGNNGKCDQNTGVGCDGVKGDDSGQSDTSDDTNPGHNPDANPGHNPDVNPGHNPDANPGHNPDVNPGHNPDVNPGHNPDVNPGQKPEENPGQKPEENPGQKPDENPGQNPEDKPGKPEKPGPDNFVYEKDIFYYHPNHLGSTAFVTDNKGKIYQHLEYFPFGETWIEEVSDQHRVPYLFTAKELDRETGLYYFGARYYDPRTSVWQSCDPILGDYLDGNPNGGVYTPLNLGTYSYSRLSPVVYFDPDGNSWGLAIKICKVLWKAGSKGFNAYDTFSTYIDAYNTLKSSDATLLQKLGAVGNATLELGTGFNAKDFKRGYESGASLVKKLSKNSEKAENLKRGRAAEKRVLKDLGLDKNTKKVKTSEGSSIPDSLTDTVSLEVKDAKSVSLTKQLRIQTGAARKTGKQSVLVTGTKTKISKPAERAFDQIIRRDDLGPQ